MCEDLPLFNSSAGADGHTLSSFTGVDKDGSFLACLTFWGNLFEVNDELLWVVLGVGEQLGGVEREDMVGNSLGTFVQAESQLRLPDVSGQVTHKNSFDSPRWP